MASIVRVRMADGNILEIPSIKGDKGEDGTVAFNDLTEEQKLSLAPYIGENGNWWVSESDTGVPADYSGQFAPSGYGLGGAEHITVEDLDSTTAPGFYDIAATMTINNVTANYWYMKVSAYGSGTAHCTQILRPVGLAKCRLERSLRSSTWDVWECNNPPLETDKEYRTTERVGGKAVYKKRNSNGFILYRLDGSETWTRGIPGAAPSGYGLGSAQPPVSEDLNKTLKNGFYYIWSGTLNTPFSHGAVLVSNYDASEIVQYVMNTPSGVFMIRRTLDGGATWTEEWAIPAMLTGVEYSTTERWKGKAVYTKLLDFGTLPNTAEKAVSLNVVPTEIIKIEPQIVGYTDLGGYITQEVAPTTAFEIGVRFLASFTSKSGSVTCYTSYDMSPYTANVVVKYTKD